MLLSATKSIADPKKIQIYSVITSSSTLCT